MTTPLRVPSQVKQALRPSNIIADGLLNPRGMCLQEDGSVLLVEAGSGHPQQTFSGCISRLRPDTSRPGMFLAPEPLVDGFRAMNMQMRMYRDEIMGLSDIACANGQCLVSHTDYVEGSKILDLQYTPPEPVFYSQGNINALCYHPSRRSWLSVKPDTNQVVEFSAEHGEQVLFALPELAQGQEAVPVTLSYEPDTDAVLITLFSGELRQTPARQGIDFVERAGAVIRANPGTGQIETLITGLQLPTGLAWRSANQLLVLELCEGLLEPLLPDWAGEVRHGGFQRYSGRLLSCDLVSAEVRILAEGLDTPSNLCLLPGAVLISEGMGLSGRLLPGPNGTTPLTGKIRRVAL